MTVVVGMEADSSKLESALNKISLKFRGLGKDADNVGKNLSKINATKIDTSKSVNQLKRLNNEVSRTNSQIQNISGSIKRSFANLAAGLTLTASAGGLIAISDSLLEMENRIALVTGRNKELLNVQKELYAISRATYSSVANSVETFSRFGLALRDAGYSQEQLLKATKSTQLALAISGGNAASASAAIFQLGQGLASGTLRGQELNSILEQAPRIAIAIADELGVSIGQIRELAAEGQITTKVVMDAMLNQTKKLNKEFKNIQPTVMQIFGIFGSSFKLAVKSFDDAFGFTKAIKSGLTSMTNTLMDNQSSIELFFLSVGTSAKFFFQDVMLIAGGLLNIASAIGSRLEKAIPVLIHPVLILLDYYELTISEGILRIASAPISGLVALRAKFFSILDPNSFAGAINAMFTAKSVFEFRDALDRLANSITTYGKRWYNFGNLAISGLRSLNIRVIETGIYLGLLNQRFIDLRYESIERIAKVFGAILVILKEVYLNIITLPVIITIIVGIDAAVRLLRNSFKALTNDVLTLLNIDSESRLLKGLLETFKLLPSASETSFLLYGGYLLSMVKVTKSSLDEFFRQWLDFIGVFEELNKIDISKNLISAITSIPVALGSALSSAVKLLNKIPALIASSGNTANKVIATSSGVTLLTTLSKDISDIRSSISDFSSSLNISSELFSKLNNAISLETVTSVFNSIINMLKQLEYWFFWLYDRVIGNSWWTDTMEYIKIYADNAIDYTINRFKTFKNTLDSVFKDIYSSSSNFADSNDLMLMIPSKRYVQLKLMSIIDEPVKALLVGVKMIWEKIIGFAPELGHQAGIAILTALLTVFSTNGLKAFQTFGKLAAAAFVGNQIFSNFGEEIIDIGILQQVFQSLGTEIGRFIKNAAKNIPVYFQMLFEGAREFTSGFLNQFGAIGRIVDHLLKIIPDGGLISNLLFGVSLSTLFFGFAKTRKMITSLFGFTRSLRDSSTPAGSGILAYMLLGKGRVLTAALVAAATAIATIGGVFNNFAPMLLIAGSVGIIGKLLFGTTGVLQLAATAADTVGRVLGEMAGVTPSTSIYDLFFRRTPGNSLRDRFNNFLSSIGETADDRTTNVWAWLEEIDLSSVQSAVTSLTSFISAQWATMTGFMSTMWASLTGFLSAQWSVFAGYFTAISVSITGAFSAMITRLSALSVLIGPLGLIGRVLLGVLGVGLILAAFTGVASASSNIIGDLINDYAWVGATGILGLALLGFAKNPSLIVTAVRSVVTITTQILLSFVGTLPAIFLAAFTPIRMALSVVLSEMLVQLSRFAGMASAIFNFGRWLLAMILPTAGTIIAAISTFVATFVAGITAAMAAAFVGVFAGIGLLGIWLFGRGDGLISKVKNFFSDVVSWVTGTTAESRKLRKEMEGIVGVTKVGSIDVNLQSKLDQINFEVLSERQINKLRKELALSNKIFERNSSIFESEGTLTREQIKETNSQFARANNTLDRLAKQGEKSFGKSLVSTLTGGLNFAPKGELSQQLQTALADNMGADNAQKTVAPVLQRLFEVITDSNSNSVEISTAFRSFYDLLKSPLISKEELASISQTTPELASMLKFLPLIDDTLKGLASDSANILTPAEQAGMVENLLTLINNTQLDMNSEGFKNLALLVSKRYLPAAAEEAGISSTAQKSVLGFNIETAKTPEELAKSLGLDTLGLLQLAAEKGQTGAKIMYDFLKGNVDLISTANKGLRETNALFAAGAGLSARVEEQESLRNSLSARLSGVGESIESELSINFEKLTEEEAKRLERALNNYDTAVAASRQRLIADNLSSLRKTFNDDVNASLSDEEFRNKIYERILEGDPSPFLTRIERESRDVAERVLSGVVEGIAEGQAKAAPLLSQFNDLLKLENIDLELNFLPVGNRNAQLDEFNSLIEELTAARDKFYQTDSEVDFLNIENIKRRFTLSFGSIEQQIEAVASTVDNSKSFEDLMALSPNTINKAIKIGIVIAKIKSILNSTSSGLLDSSMQEALKTQVKGFQAELQGLLGDTSDKKGSKKTWWETFLGNVSSTDFDFDADLVAGMSKSLIGSLVKESKKYLAAQEAITNSTADEVELRRKSLEVMKQSRANILQESAKGTVGQLQAALASLGTDFDLAEIATFDPKKLKDIMKTTLDAMELEFDLKFKLKADSDEAQEAGESLELLKKKIEEFSDETQSFSGAFSEGLADFLKGKASFLDIITGFLDDFTSRIIDKFSESFSEKVFDMLGIDEFLSGALNAASSVGATAAQSIASGASKEVTADSGGFFSNLFGNIGGIFKSIFSWIGGLFGGGGGAAAGVAGHATGGLIRGPGTGTSDSIAALLSDGEYVINAASTKKYQPLLEAINRDEMPRFASGGQVGPANRQAFRSAVQERNASQTQTFNLEITGDVSRQTRKEVYGMIKEITAGVNSTNRERGARS